MIDEFSTDGTGWARFSDDRRMRYRLARAITPRALGDFDRRVPMDRTIFVMLNPSTADAFVLDPTVRRCVEFARRWGSDVLEVVNLFALRSTDPSALLDHHSGERGDDPINDREIIEACTKPGRSIIVTAWGNHGTLDDRALQVCRMLAASRCETFHLGTSQSGNPKHPLARGKSFIPYDVVPTRWDVDWKAAIR
jgi:hypothetical protein